ncbi:hypothetical protein BDZ89DRAFT_1061422, partial [Hymenopellis radicata]
MSDQLRSQIYVLTALLKDVQNRRPDGISKGQHLPKDHGVLNTSLSMAGKTFQHLATILTRGTEDEKDRIIAVTGGPVNENPLRSILLRGGSPSTSPTITPSNSNETNNNDDEPVPPENNGPLLVTRNSSHLDKVVPLVREGTLPTVVSEEVRKMLQQDQQPALASVYADFFDYLPIAFQVLKYAAQGTREERHRADLFFVTQCRDKIRQRIRALFVGYNMEILKTWTPSAYEDLSPRNLVIKHKSLQFLLRETLLPGTTDQFIFSHDHAAKWLNTILNILKYIQVQFGIVNPSILEHTRLTRGLTHLLTLLTTIPRDLWSLRSLDMVVSAARDRRPEPSYRAGALDDSTEELNTDVHEDDDDLDDSLESKASWTDLPASTVRFVRAIHAACAWIAASHFISGSALLKQPLKVSYCALDLPVEMPTFHLASNIFTKWFEAIDDEQARQQLINGANNHCNNLENGTAKGACHCESGFMSALVAQSQEEEMSDLPFLDFSRNMTRELDIGVAKKSCGTCWLLAEVIKEEEEIDIRLPGTHYRYYPWLPPPYLPEHILLCLRDKLLERLVTMVNEEKTTYQATSPASLIGDWSGSDFDDDPEFVESVEAM